MRARLYLATLFSLAVTHMAAAHAVAGARVFVNTLEIDDPGVGDEANLPILSANSLEGGGTAVDANIEYDKTITPQTAIGIGTTFDALIHDMLAGGKTLGGFEDPYVQFKYRWSLLPDHEFISSVAVQRNFGRVGTAGFDDGFNSTTWSGFFGKGLGDIPYDPVRPFALTDELDYTVPDAGLARGGDIQTWSGGLTLQYSIPYLQSQIKSYGLPTLLANLTPLVELGWTSAAGRSAFAPTHQPTTFILGTGAVWTGEYYSVSAEMLSPLNAASGHGLGVIGQFHLYFDDLYPNSLGKPLFGA